MFVSKKFKSKLSILGTQNSVLTTRLCCDHTVYMFVFYYEHVLFLSCAVDDIREEEIQRSRSGLAELAALSEGANQRKAAAARGGRLGTLDESPAVKVRSIYIM